MAVRHCGFCVVRLSLFLQVTDADPRKSSMLRCCLRVLYPARRRALRQPGCRSDRLLLRRPVAEAERKAGLSETALMANGGKSTGSSIDDLTTTHIAALQQIPSLNHIIGAGKQL